MPTHFHSIVLGLALALALAPAAAAKLTELQKTDTLTGSGRLAMVGSTVVVHYAGWLYAPGADGQRGAHVDSSQKGAPFSFKLGAGSVIKGWDEGVRGMRVGGKRTLIVPAQLGFGKTGRGSVPAGANLIFEIELVEVK